MSAPSPSRTGATLKRPVQIVKKRSGPLDDALAELQSEDLGANNSSRETPKCGVKPPPRSVVVLTPGRTGGGTSTVTGTATGMATPIARRRQSSVKDKKRERWLLTRKTWKYMTDAGRKLIPDGAQNRKEDIPKIEAHFQQVCAGEPRFVLWRRKCSYPGATRQSKRRRLKQLLQHSERGQQQQQQRERADAFNADRIIALLQTHLQLDSAYKTTTLLSAKTVRPDQTASPSAQRPAAAACTSDTFITAAAVAPKASGAECIGADADDELEQIAARLRLLLSSGASPLPNLSVERINPALLADKQALKQIYNALRKQQLHRALHTSQQLEQHSERAGDLAAAASGGGGSGTANEPRLKHSTSLSNFLYYGLGSTFGSGNKQHQQQQQQQQQPQPTPQQQQQQQTQQQRQLDSPDFGATVATPMATSMKNTLCCSGDSSAGNARNSFSGGGRSKNNSGNTSCQLPSVMPPTSRLRKPPNTLPLHRPSSSNNSHRSKLHTTAPADAGAAALRTSGTAKKAAAIATANVERQFNMCGTQTNFIQLPEIKRLAEEYKEQRKLFHEEEAAAAVASGAANTDEEDVRSASSANMTTLSQALRRKSSIDNEDISQSVSDTIKRYLRMARKKSVHDDTAANRFKRVNYDRNLRNIRAKGEINPPGIDEDNHKAVQTLDAWPLITLNFIRGIDNATLLEVAHGEWMRALDERLRKKREYEEKLKAGANVSTEASVAGGAATKGEAQQQPKQQRLGSLGSSSSSAPTSPTSDTMKSGTGSFATMPTGHSSHNHNNTASNNGLFHTSSQFFSNLWHGTSATTPHQHHQHDWLLLSPTTSELLVTVAATAGSTTTAGNVAMQKSKSSSNVGQFVSRKLLKSRSKSQTRNSGGTEGLAATPTTTSLESHPQPLPKWAPSHKLIWSNEHGDQLAIGDAALQQLSDIEAKMLRYVAFQKINELNIGISLSNKCIENVGASSSSGGSSSHKLKRRVLPKKKAMTTSFFDIGKKLDDSAGGATQSIFGNSLETCLANEQKRRRASTHQLSAATTERGSRNSIASLFRYSIGAESSGEDLRSCGLNSGKGAASHLSHSQTDVRTQQQQQQQQQLRRSSTSHDYDVDVGSSEALLRGSTIEATQLAGGEQLQVPEFVTECIKHLEEYGLQQIGLFRVSTSKKRVKQLREEFDKSAFILIEPDTCPHDVATLLKEFLRDLPEPLLCMQLHKAFLETQRIRNRRLQLEAISHLVKLLPPAHRDTLYVLLKFLAKVAAHSDDIMDTGAASSDVQVPGNKMDSNNLATVFAPNILRSASSETDAALSGGAAGAAATVAAAGCEQQTMCDAINVLRIMIDHYEEIYRVPAELLHNVYACMLDECPQQLYALCQQRNANSSPMATSPTRTGNVEQQLSPLSSPQSPTQQQQKFLAKTLPKRLYTRVSVMHDNDAASCNTPAQSAGIVGGANSSAAAAAPGVGGGGGAGGGGVPNASYKHHHNYAHSNAQHEQQQLQQVKRSQSNDSVNGRLAAGSVADSSGGIVTASLQITMPPTASASGAAAYANTAALGGGYEYTYIPYIEDGSTEYAPISGLLSFTTKTDGTAIAARRQQANQRSTGGASKHGIVTTPTPSHASSGDDGGCGGNSKASVSTSCIIGGRAAADAVNEPKVPASISNIGGAILRSKTADFERMSSPSKKLTTLNQQRASVTQQQQQQQQSTAYLSTSAPHLYKRQELIASNSSAKLARAVTETASKIASKHA